jgi:hypothetical protein
MGWWSGRDLFKILLQDVHKGLKKLRAVSSIPNTRKSANPFKWDRVAGRVTSVLMSLSRARWNLDQNGLMFNVVSLCSGNHDHSIALQHGPAVILIPSRSPCIPIVYQFLTGCGGMTNHTSFLLTGLAGVTVLYLALTTFGMQRRWRLP